MATVEKLTPLPLSVPKEADFNDSVESPYMIEVADESTSRFTRFKDSFRRKVVDESQKHEIGRQMSKAISLRHLILMALVTGIGTGLLVGTGLVLHKSGPLFLVIGFAIVGSFCIPLYKQQVRWRLTIPIYLVDTTIILEDLLTNQLHLQSHGIIVFNGYLSFLLNWLLLQLLSRIGTQLLMPTFGSQFFTS